MKINIISVGKIKEQYFIDAIEEYKKRISKYSNIELITVMDESNDLDSKTILKKEGERILSKIPNNSYTIALDLKGKELDSVGLAKKIDEITQISSTINFIIGGSIGLDSSVLDKADYRLCFSKFTFPHKLMKLILLEQIYRSFKINNNESYHK
ncbi:MAG: 23S rRNA (pseudouridine(1915)-N(3))-methyltransferase RlmH [Acholeplasmatales bacterium]|nr:23S rRNA (pseudouridine(1915)-N(3))-methyltransferase RlmH [Acholeplasmatales bacterium]